LIDSVLPGKTNFYLIFLYNIFYLSGYTDGTCPFNNKRYFNCPDGQGYYILETSFINSYEIVQKKMETKKLTTSDDEFNSAE